MSQVIIFLFFGKIPGKEEGMKCNVGKKDRIIRIVVGLVILISHYVYYAITGYYCVWANLGYVPLLTGLFKFCPVYVPLKINTSKERT